MPWEAFIECQHIPGTMNGWWHLGDKYEHVPYSILKDLTA